MCFLRDDTDIHDEQIATKPFKVYKAFFIREYDGRIFLGGICQYFEFPIKKVLTAKDEEGRIVKGFKLKQTQIHYGFHALVDNNHWKTFSLGYSVIMECEIPKGAKYVTNYRGEIVSTKIKVIKYIRTDSNYTENEYKDFINTIRK